jgi:hypothetical protein
MQRFRRAREWVLCSHCDRGVLRSTADDHFQANYDHVRGDRWLHTLNGANPMVSCAQARSPPILTNSSTSNVLPETPQLALVDNRVPAVGDEMDDVMELDRGGAGDQNGDEEPDVKSADHEVIIDIGGDDSKVVVIP